MGKPKCRRAKRPERPKNGSPGTVISVPGMVKSAGIVHRMIENETRVDTVDSRLIEKGVGRVEKAADVLGYSLIGIVGSLADEGGTIEAAIIDP